ncbi:MAG: hypothetical protein OET87_08440, partial [Desulfobulbaceae bacterium]|nr:hypothetical protein [Desulfobulbaceae bacterium]
VMKLRNCGSLSWRWVEKRGKIGFKESRFQGIRMKNFQKFIIKGYYPFCHFTQPSSAEKEGIARGLSEPLQVASFAAP